MRFPVYVKFGILCSRYASSLERCTGMLKVQSLLFAAFLLPSLAAVADNAKHPFEGAWAPSAKACADPTDGNIRITSGKYFEHEGSCSIVQAAKAGSVWTLSLSCEGEGEKWKKSVKLEPKGSGQLEIVHTGAASSKLVRCKAEQRPPNWPAR